MSIAGDVGAQAAAEDVIEFIRKRLEELRTYTAQHRSVGTSELEAVLKHAEGIRDAAKAGWY